MPKQRKSINVFWAEMAACEHCVQIYDDDAAFLDALEGYVASALGLDEAVIIIATGSHTELLTNRLQVSGIDMPGAIAHDQFIAIDATCALSAFMRDGWPDEALFLSLVRTLLKRARA
ncbi:MEDS domain-containing protein [Massilia sp. H-1]|nr:MEDS domain-containing protein [Massilia sp. H-1]